MKNILKVFCTTVLLALALTAEAIIVSLEPVSQTEIVMLGEQFSLDVFYDTENANTVGGAFSVNFISGAFELISVNFDSTLNDDPFFRVSPDIPLPVSSGAFNLGFGSFSGILGSGKLATLLFESSQEGTFDFTLDTPLNGHDLFNEPTTFINSQVEVSSVPLPGAIWLFMSSLIGGLGFIKRKKCTN